MSDLIGGNTEGENMSVKRRNLELKSYCDNEGIVRAAATGLGARSSGRTEQSDVYFKAARGRLKLRTTTQPGSTDTQLIAYFRPDDTFVRSSDFVMGPVSGPAVEPLRTALEMSCGVVRLVTKYRERLEAKRERGSRAPA